MHDVGHHDLGVAVLRGVEIEEEVDQRALEPGAGALQDREARAGELGGALEVEDPEPLSDLHVALGVRDHRGRSPGLDRGVVVLVLPLRHGVVQEVRDPHRGGVDVGLHGEQLGVDPLGPLVPLGHERLERLGARRVARLHLRADLARERVPVRAQLVALDDQLPAQPGERDDLVDGGEGLGVRVAAREARFGDLRFVGQQVGVVHGVSGRADNARSPPPSAERGAQRGDIREFEASLHRDGERDRQRCRELRARARRAWGRARGGPRAGSSPPDRTRTAGSARTRRGRAPRSARGRARSPSAGTRSRPSRPSWGAPPESGAKPRCFARRGGGRARAPPTWPTRRLRARAGGRAGPSAGLRGGSPGRPRADPARARSRRRRAPRARRARARGRARWPRRRARARP